MPVPLVETWGEFLHYGANLVLSAGEPFRLAVLVGPPEVDRLGEAARRGVRSARAQFEASVRDGRLLLEGGEPPEPPGAGWIPGDDVLLARAEAGTLVAAGPYLVGLGVRPAATRTRWRDGKLAEEPPPTTGVDLVLVLLEQATGRTVPGADVTLELTSAAGGALPKRVPLRAVLGPYDHYAGHAAVPAGELRGKVRIRRPTFATLVPGAFDATVEAPVSLGRASAADSPAASSKRP